MQYVPDFIKEGEEVLKCEMNFRGSHELLDGDAIGGRCSSSPRLYYVLSCPM